MQIEKLNSVYFLGVGGIGMSALARYFLSQGCAVYGYDKTKTELTEQLEKEGIKIHYQEDIELLDELFKDVPNDTLVCYTPAIPSDNLEYQYFKNNNINLLKRSQVLGLISQNYTTIAIAGTHGKTTTSSIVAHILNESAINCIAFLGGISLNFNSNLLINNDATVMVVEADEYDRSFLTLSPNIALITSLDADHLDIYGDGNEMQNAYKEFCGKIVNEGALITKQSFIEQLDLREDIAVSTYALTDQAVTFASKLVIRNGAYYADIKSKNEEIKDIEIGLPGIHNVENAIGAFAIAEKLGLDKEQIKQSLTSFKGVKRRFEYHVKTNDIVYIDDYAHHPSELEVAIQSVKELYPTKKITGVFQPHLYTRTRDFVDEFAKSLSLLDELVLMNIYPARELPIEGITSQIILDKVSCKTKSIVLQQELLNFIENAEVEVLLTLGAGDIDVFVKPIAEILGGSNE